MPEERNCGCTGGILGGDGCDTQLLFFILIFLLLFTNFGGRY